jgi:hypothetical protein
MKKFTICSGGKTSFGQMLLVSAFIEPHITNEMRELITGCQEKSGIYTYNDFA